MAEAAATAALKSLRGDFSDKVKDLSYRLVTARVNVEVQMDFVEEEIDHLAISTMRKDVEEMWIRKSQRMGVYVSTQTPETDAERLC